MLAISEEFLSYQGEGTLTGTRMYFIRTQGCGVGCYFCDTKYTWKKEDAVVKEKDIAKRAKDSRCDIACITGGEPAEQNLEKLIDCLHDQGLAVQIETSGMYYFDWMKKIDHVVVSPKDLFAKKGIKADDRIMDIAEEYKCVVTKESDIDYYVNKLKNWEGGYKIFQPVDSSPEIAQLILEKEGINEWLLMCQQQAVLKLR